jgi:uncharacterized protein YprB with RNaseH-like and TPR domain
VSLYLDIETDYERQITVLGMYHRSYGLIQLVSPKISRYRLLQALPVAERLFTFNGHCFDLPYIYSQLGIDLRNKFESSDLRYLCEKINLRGGQKRIERRLGFSRRFQNLDGRKAQYLWYRYMRKKDEAALRLLLAYNSEDIMNMVRIRSYLRLKGVLR